MPIDREVMVEALDTVVNRLHRRLVPVLEASGISDLPKWPGAKLPESSGKDADAQADAFGTVTAIDVVACLSMLDIWCAPLQQRCVYLHRAAPAPMPLQLVLTLRGSFHPWFHAEHSLALVGEVD